MSLIESTLAKLRRGGESDAHRDVPVPPRAVIPLAASKGPAVVVAASPVPEPEERAKRIAIDLRDLRASGYLPEEGLERRFSDHYREIKRPLIENALGGGSEMRLIVVTSALPGDGKTFTSISLALSMAHERDASVLLVDADLPRANVSRVFGLRNERGMTDALLDETLDVESLLIGTDVPGLDILPAGKYVENATELLASARMAQIAARMVNRNPRRLVLFDSSPLIGSSEARALVRLPGQMIIVVRAGVTPRHAIIDAVGMVDKHRLQGLVLNDAHLQRGAGYYYGYSTYGAAEDREGRGAP